MPESTGLKMRLKRKNQDNQRVFNARLGIFFFSVGHLIIIQQVQISTLADYTVQGAEDTEMKRTSRSLLSVSFHPDHPLPTYKETKSSSGQVSASLADLVPGA